MHDHPVLSALNWTSAISVIGTLIGVLPHVAAALGVIWYCILLYDRFFAKQRRLTK